MNVTFQLTNICNLKCIHCFQDKSLPRKFLSPTLFKKILNELSSYSINKLCFSGGEPTLHPDFSKIIEITVKKKFRYTIVTNGMTFERVYPTFLRNNHSKYLTCILFSLDGANENTHDVIRGIGAFRKVMQAISIAYIKKIPFGLQMIINSLNKNECKGFISLATKLKASFLRFGFLMPTENLVKASLLLSPLEINETWERIKKLKEMFKIEIIFDYGYYMPEKFFSCPILSNDDFTVDCEGNLTVCCMLSGASTENKSDIIGSLKNEHLWALHKRLIDKNAKFQKHRIKLLKDKKLKFLDHFPCIYCGKYYGKLNWIKFYPKSPWHS